MAIINYKSVRQYTDNAPTYCFGLLIIQSGTEEKDIINMCSMLRRLCRKYNGLAYLLTPSSTKSNDGLMHRVVHTSKPGRPKTVVLGNKCENHYHCLIICLNPSRNNYSKYFVYKSVKHIS